MLGYKIYFNGEKFIMEDTKSPIEDIPMDSDVSWNATLDTAKVAVDNRNRHHKSNPEELVDFEDFLVRKCKNCNNYFILSSMKVKWFEGRRLILPLRCNACKKRKKLMGKS